MRTSFICASCRRQLPRAARNNLLNSSFSHSAAALTSNPPNDASPGRQSEAERHSGLDTSQENSIHEKDHSRSAEQDFIQRILRSRDPTQFDEPYSKFSSPRYARATRRKHFFLSESSTSATQDDLDSRLVRQAAAEQPSVQAEPGSYVVEDTKDSSAPERLLKKLVKDPMEPKQATLERTLIRKLDGPNKPSRSDQKAVRYYFGTEPGTQQGGPENHQQSGSVGQSKSAHEIPNPPQAKMNHARNVFRRVASKSTSKPGIAEDGKPRLNSKTGLSPLHESIHRAVATRRPDEVEHLWESVTTTLPLGLVHMPLSLYAAYLEAFMSLRRPSRAIDVWNHMVSNNVQPDVAAWTAMIKGCGIARDAKALEEMWSNMIESGIEPDVQVWTVRINGLVKSGSWQTSIRAFEDMMEAWLRAVQRKQGKAEPENLANIGNIESIPKPNNQTVNALVDGLARGRKHTALLDVLCQARAIGIKPDAYTFNPLFRTALSDGNTALAVRMLDQMLAHGLKPDIATFTMIIHTYFANKSSPTDDGQPSPQDNIFLQDLLSDMRRCGLEPTTWTYTVIINGLLQDPKHSTSPIPAVEAILTTMSESGISASSAIYTVLVTHHFASSDLAAVETVWRRARADRAVHLDIVFYDRLIEGFARARDHGRATVALVQATRAGKTPGYRAMTDIVRALGAAGEVARVRELVAAVRRDEGARDSVRSPTGKAEFWAAVEDMSLRVDEVEAEVEEEVEGVEPNDAVGAAH